MDLKINDIKNNLTPARWVVGLFVLDVLLWLIHMMDLVGGAGFMLMYYTIILIAGAAVVWQALVFIRLSMHWQQGA